MPNILKALQGASGNAGEALYVEDVFSTYLYTGNGSTQSITNGIDLSGEGGLVWIKNRDQADSHILTDTARGAGEVLSTNATTAETTDADTTTAFNSDGFSIGADVKVNTNTEDYVSWTFRKAEKFFTVVPYTGDGNASQTINHDLGSTPGCIIVKNLSQADAWYVYHRSNTASPETDYLVLNTNAGTVDSAGAWNDTAPTSTQFTVGTDDNVNASGESYVAYLFAHDAGGFGDDGSESIIKCGSYTGNNSADGPTVTLGFEPQWVLIKESSAAGNAWSLYDMMRNGTMDQHLRPNSSDAESIAAASPEVLPQATGFKLNTSSGRVNGSQTYIYIAIRRPMKTPESGTEVFAIDAPSGTNAGDVLTSGFVDDTIFRKYRTLNSGFTTASRLTGKGVLTLSSTNDENTSQERYGFDVQDGVELIIGDGAYDMLYYHFKRATGFFDVVCYKGTNSAENIAHNLGAVPEMMIVKPRGAGAWIVYHKDNTANPETDYLVLNSTNATSDYDGYWNDTSPTDSQFSVGTASSTSGVNYVAYLFATLAGVSKVGSYTGNGTSQTIDCGFSGGARFILIKSTSTTGSWWVYDSARGIVAGNDPALQLNSTAAEVTSADAIDPDSSGFIVNQEATCSINASGVSYIFMSIA